MSKTILIALVILCAVMVCGCLDTAVVQKSVTIGGHTFTAALDDKWATSVQGEAVPYVPANLEDQYGIPDGAYDWTGLEDYGAFSYKSGQPSGSITKYGFVYIFILNPNEDLADSSSIDILRHAAYLIIDPGNHRNAVLGGDLTEKEIEYNGKEAYLVEVSGELKEDHINDNSYGAISFFLDNDTVALIGVHTTNNYGISAWDVIESITVT